LRDPYVIIMTVKEFLLKVLKGSEKMSEEAIASSDAKVEESASVVKDAISHDVITIHL
jgi:hypothetical protein